MFPVTGVDVLVELEQSHQARPYQVPYVHVRRSPAYPIKQQKNKPSIGVLVWLFSRLRLLFSGRSRRYGCQGAEAVRQSIVRVLD